MRPARRCRPPRPSRRAGDDRGTVLIITAVSMVAMLAMAAIVLDLAVLRQDRAADRAAADAAALAAVTRLNEDPVAGTPVAVSACRDAWTYFLQNRPDATPVVTVPNCSGAFTTRCNGTVRSTTGVAGPYTVTIRYPVPNGDPLMQSERLGGDTAQAVTDIDGDPCGRFGVQVVRDRELAFGRVAGMGDGTTSVHSVAVATTSNDARFPIALLILDPVGCGVLIANGGGNIRVRSIGTHPGFISVDSDASQCTGGNYATDAQGSGSTIRADGTLAGEPGVVRLYGLRAALCNGTDHACDPSDVAGGTLAPQPEPAPRRTGRAQVDWRFNCKGDYGTMDVGRCPLTGQRNPYIDQLTAAVGGTGAPTGFLDYRASYPCNVGPGAVVTVPEGNWYVNCNLDVKGLVRFTGGNVVFQSDLKVGSSGSIVMNNGNTGSLSAGCEVSVCATESSANHAFAYFRTGGITRVAGGSIAMHNTFVYLRTGTVDLTGGNGTIVWTAPGTDHYATKGPFEDLALWSDSSADHGMSGGSALTIDGVFFTPRALFTYSGTGAQVQAKAQFITYRLKVTGSGELVMSPDPERAVEFPLSLQRLIR